MVLFNHWDVALEVVLGDVSACLLHDLLARLGLRKYLDVGLLFQLVAFLLDFINAPDLVLQVLNPLLVQLLLGFEKLRNVFLENLLAVDQFLPHLPVDL